MGNASYVITVTLYRLQGCMTIVRDCIMIDCTYKYNSVIVLQGMNTTMGLLQLEI